MTEVKEPLTNANDIYGLSMLRRRLNGEVVPLKQENTNRSSTSLKSFRPEKINTANRTEREVGEPFSNEIRKIDPPTVHTFVNKIVAYNEEGL